MPAISIHALLAESDCRPDQHRDALTKFLSTLSLRRATCGWTRRRKWAQISIHALLAESDNPTSGRMTAPGRFLSTLSLRRATLMGGPAKETQAYFYPRSPCGERRSTSLSLSISNDFYPRSPCGERLAAIVTPPAPSYFYPRSPCGERRKYHTGHTVTACISIHALLAESDKGNCEPASHQIHFYPRSPCGERHTYTRTQSASLVISIHALLAESDPTICNGTLPIR